jgi:hypothetical protein
MFRLTVVRNSGHSPTAWRTGQIDPKATFRFDAMNAREARESGRPIGPEPGEIARRLEAQGCPTINAGIRERCVESGLGNPHATCVASQTRARSGCSSAVQEMLGRGPNLL